MNKIIEHLYLGSHADISSDYLDHYKIDVVICVLESPHCLKRNETDGRDWIHIPIMHYVEDEKEILYDKQDYGEHAEPEALDRVAHIINGAIRLKKNVLVHCGAGLERSPLAVAWYLSTKKHITFNQAYDIINKSRKVYNRISWLPPKYRRDY